MIEVQLQSCTSFQQGIPSGSTTTRVPELLPLKYDTPESTFRQSQTTVTTRKAGKSRVIRVQVPGQVPGYAYSSTRVPKYPGTPGTGRAGHAYMHRSQTGQQP
eukprot:851022-Rhodomonas_salina.1